MSTAASRPSVLLVAQFAPPGGFSAARRTQGLTKYLTRLGHPVTVLTSPASGTGAVPGAARTVRTRDLVTSRVNWRRGNLESAREGGEAAYAEPSPVAAWVVPDLSAIGWLPFLLPRAREAVRRGEADCVITTSPPESAHLAGLALRRMGVPWIADLRDGWTFESTHPERPLGALRRLEHWLERRVATTADLVTTVTDEITDDLRARLGANAVTLPNGFDPEERVQAEPADVGLDPGRVALVHTGRMAFSGRSPRPLLEGLARLRAGSPELAGRLELVFAGPLSAEEGDLIAAAGDGVRAVGTLPRGETLKLQSAAGALLLLTGRGRRSEATAKLYEYLAAGRPILVLGEGSAAARVVCETGSGTVTSAEDPEAIAAALAEVADGVSSPAGGEAVQRYAYPDIAGRLSAEIQRLAGV